MEEGVMDKCGDSEVKSWTGRIKTELFYDSSVPLESA